MSSKRNTQHLKGALLVFISSLMFGSYGLFARVQAQYDIFYLTFVRCFFIAVIYILYGIFTKQFKKIDKKDWKWFATVLIFTNFTSVPIIYAFEHISIGTASFLFYASLTIFTYILGIIFFKEKMDFYKIFSLVLAFSGLLLLFTIRFSWLLFLPMILASLNGFASGGEVTFSKKISEKYSNVQINSLIFGSIAVTHFIISIILHEQMNIQLVTTDFPILLAFTAVSIIGMTTVIEGFKYVEPSVGAIVGLTEIIFSVLLGYFIFHESLSVNTFIGGSLILIASILPNIPDLLKIKS